MGILRKLFKTGSKEDKNSIVNFMSADVGLMGDPEKKEDLLVAFIIPSLDGMFHFSILHLWTFTALQVKYVINCVAEDTYLQFCRNKLIDTANQIATDMQRWIDYYFFLDQDSVVPPDLFVRLYRDNRDIVSASYIRKRRWIPVWTPIPV